MTQNFYNIFISKIGALPIILIPSFWKSIENSDHNDFFIFLISDKFSVPTRLMMCRPLQVDFLNAIVYMELKSD